MRTISALFLFATITLFAVGITIYANSLQVPFYFDDSHNVQNPVIQIDEVSYDKLSDIVSLSALKTRPISNLSFALNHYIGGKRVQGYHLINILIHIATAIASFFLIYVTLSIVDDNRIQGHKFKIAFFTALLWLCHPVATQSVTYIVQRMNSMAAMFYIFSLLFYALGRLTQRIPNKNISDTIAYYGFFLLCLTTGMLAIGSKEIAATLPIAIFFYEWFFFQNLQIKWLKVKTPYLLATALFFVTIALIYTGGNITGAIFDGYKGRTFTLEERLLTQLRVIVHYLDILVFPSPDRLFLDHSFPISKSLANPLSTLFSGAFLIVLIIAGIGLARKERIFSFCIFWFFLNLLIESSVIPLEIVYEHRTYLPSLFFILLFVTLFFRFVHFPRLVVALLVSLSCLFCFWTIQRNATWNDPIAFWSKSLDKYPSNARVHTNLGVEYFKAGDLDQAESHFRTALKLKPQNALVYNNLAEIKERRGDYLSTETFLKKAIEITPQHVLARLNLGSLYKKTGRFNESFEQYSFIHKRYPEFSTPNIEMGQLLLRDNKPLEALPHLEKALPKKPTNTTLLLAIAEAHMRLGNTLESIKYYEKALEQQPNHVIALFNLALLHSGSKNREKALDKFNKAFLLQPEFVPVAFNYGNFLLRTGDIDKAEETYLTFLSQERLMADAHNNLGLVYINRNEPQKALHQFELASRINPNHPLASRNAQLARESLANSKKESSP